MDGPIAIYLFLLGISAGSATLSVLLRRQGAGSESGIIKATAILAPVSVVLGLLILIFHLARPWTFWKLMFHYQFDSVMSMGVMLFQIYMAVLFAWLAVVFRAEIEALRRRLLVDRLAFVDGLIGWLARFERLLAPLLLLLAVLLGPTPAFCSQPSRPTPCSTTRSCRRCFWSPASARGGLHHLAGCHPVSGGWPQPGVSFVHCFERPIVAIELFLLLCFFTGLYFGGGQRKRPCGRPSVAASGPRCSGSGSSGWDPAAPAAGAGGAVRQGPSTGPAGAYLQPEPGGDIAAALLHPLRGQMTVM